MDSHVDLQHQRGDCRSGKRNSELLLRRVAKDELRTPTKTGTASRESVRPANSPEDQTPDRHRGKAGEPSRLWIWEVWQESRETVKAIAGEGLLFILLMFMLSTGHYLVARMPLEEEQLALIETWHFWVNVAAWWGLGVTLLAEIAIASTTKIYTRVKQNVPSSKERSDDEPA